jgi:predicted helicase
LRAHQRRAVAAIRAALAEGGLGQVAMACGSGKTMVAIHSAVVLLPRGGRVLVLVPSLGLLAQTVRAWRQDAHVPLEVLAVCSDQVAERGPDGARSVADLAGELDLEATTAPERVAAFLAVAAPAAPGLRVMFGTYHSSPPTASPPSRTCPAGAGPTEPNPGEPDGNAKHAPANSATRTCAPSWPATST